MTRYCATSPLRQGQCDAGSIGQVTHDHVVCPVRPTTLCACHSELMMASYGNPLMPIEKSLIDRCISLVYRDYLKNPRPENMPILGDLYQCLREQHNSRADDLATAMEIYVTGSCSSSKPQDKRGFE